MSLKEIFCQDKAIEILQLAFAAGKVPHAYIFAGLDGIGKFKTACEWGKLLLCKNPTVKNNFADSCGKCDSCRSFEASSHPDFHHVYKELREFTTEGKNKPPPVDVPIDVVREFLIEKASIKPSLSQRKVFIISEAEKLNIASQNCLLKTLEEPPSYCCIILLCSRLDKLFATIKSRCQTIRFQPIDEQVIIEKLSELGIQRTQARYFARLSQGSLGQAHHWAKLELAGADLYRTKTELINSISDYKFADSLELSELCWNKSKKITETWEKIDENTSKTDLNRRALKTIILMVISFLQDAMKLNLPDEKSINFDQKEQVKKLARRFNPEQSAEKIADCYKSLQLVEASVNERLIFDQLLLNLAISDTMRV